MTAATEVRRAVSLLAFVAALSAGCDRRSPTDLVPEEQPAQLDIVSGNDQIAPTGTELPEPLVVRVMDAAGRPTAGHVVNFVVTEGGGAVLAGTATTNSQGLAQERWTLGPGTGLQTVEVHAVHPTTGETLLVDTFTATAISAGGEIHEPAGFTLINERNFDTKATDDCGNCGGQGWDGSESREDWSIVDDPTAPESPDRVAQMMYEAGMDGGSSPQGQAYVNTGGPSRLYHRFYLKLSANFHGHRTGTNKIFHLWADGRNHVFYSAGGSNEGRLEFDVHLQGSPRSGEFDPNLASGEIVRGRWHQIEVLTELNTPGSSDGRVRVWIDGVQTHDHRNMEIIDSDASRRFSMLQWSPTWGGIGDTLSETQYMWLDHSYVSGAN